MPFIEQLLYGVNLKDDKPSKSVLASSSGMGDKAAAEIVRLCDNWGPPPPLGLEQPALMSFSLTSTIRAIPGRLFTVIRAGRGLNPLFHAVVLSEGSYATFLRNPFAVAQAVDFCDEWNPQVKLQRAEIDYDSTRPLVDPAPNESDIGLVDEAVVKLIAEGKLLMPIEQANAQSDRCLALIIACMPEKARKKLRFTSFAPNEANNYTLAGVESEGCVFAGWQRMMMAWLAGDNVKGVDNYIEEIRKYLAAGDLAGVSRTSQRQQVHSRPTPDLQDNLRKETVSAAMPVQGSSRDRQEPPLALDSLQASLPRSKPSRTRWQAPDASQAGSPGPGPSPVPARSNVRPKPEKPSPLVRKFPNPKTKSRGRRFPRANAVRVAVLVLILALAGTAGLMWKEGRTLAESLEWANLQGLMGEKPRTERAATLLEVVDVGEVYGRQLKLLTNSGKGLNPSVDKGRHKALANLRDLAVQPLNQQVELFAKLAADGIQQASRPDREAQRLQSLADQGLVLENELTRLELAWYSLAAGVFWRDISTLSDQAVIARRDSLSRVGKGVLQDVRRDLGTLEAKQVLDQTRGHVSGMALLLTLFEASTYSREWEKALSQAAGQVAPTASRMTRAYTNSAFALVRLKKAERRGDQTFLPYRRGLADQDWPSSEIRVILTNLRAQTVMFPKGRIPGLLTGTLELYSALKKPVTLAAKVAESPRALSRLEDNPAVRFHPRAYGEFLARIRYEAAVLHLKDGGDPELIPEYLYTGSVRDQVAGFRITMDLKPPPEVWESLATSDGLPFLDRWAGHLSAVAKFEFDKAREKFDKSWLECRKTAARLQDEAVAGRDWSRTWLSLHGQAKAISSLHTDHLGADPERSQKLADINNLLVALRAHLPLDYLSGTIRLDQDRLTEPVRARLEVRTSPAGSMIRSDDFQIGLAAPAGMGWVGTVSLKETLKIHAGQGLEIKVVADDGDETLLEVSCPSLSDGVGPGGMVRPRSGDGGSVSLKIDPAYWKSLQLPALGMIF
ncbi:MAG: hypothetical protein ABFS42_09955 [Candidatus Krumholzibacteriota bacterium]